MVWIRYYRLRGCDDTNLQTRREGFRRGCLADEIKGARMLTILWWVIVGLIAGWATGKIMKGAGYGVLVDILLGIAGAIIGSRILAMLGIFTTGGLIPSILVAIFGAVILVAIVRAIKKA